MTARCALYKWIEWVVRRYGHSKLSKISVSRQLGFNVNGNSVIRFADPENPTLKQNMKCIGSPVAEIWPFAYLWGIWNPHLGRRGSHRGSAMAPFETAMVVSYRLSIVTVALSVTIRPQFAIECLRRSNQQAGGSLWAKISGCSTRSRPLTFGSVESEYLSLTNGELLWKNSNYLITIHQRHRQTDRQTDRRHAIERPRAVKTAYVAYYAVKIVNINEHNNKISTT